MMAEAQQARVQQTVEEMVQNLERDHIRKMQVKSQLGDEFQLEIKSIISFCF